jgi:hypothetical protein
MLFAAFIGGKFMLCWFFVSECKGKLRNKSARWFIAHSILVILQDDVFVSVGGTAPNTFPNANPFRLPRRITVMRIECFIAQDKRNNRPLKRLHKTKLR